MKNLIKTFLTAGFFLAATTLMAQDDKRGDTDYTNNRKEKTKDEKTEEKPQVNTDQPTPVKIIQYLPGVWTLEQLSEGQSANAANGTGAERQTIEFNREGRYMIYSENEKIDSGAYRINENHALLYLESDVDYSQSQWSVGFGEDGSMTMWMKDPKKGESAEDFKYVYRRSGPPSSPNGKSGN